MMKDLECPYCGYEQDVCCDGQHDEDVLHEMQCCECEKYFVFRTVISFDYYPHQANCLNDGDHKWEASFTFPVFCTKMICSDCGESRIPTLKEWGKIEKDRKTNVRDEFREFLGDHVDTEDKVKAIFDMG